VTNQFPIERQPRSKNNPLTKEYCKPKCDLTKAVTIKIIKIANQLKRAILNNSQVNLFSNRYLAPTVAFTKVTNVAVTRTASETIPEDITGSVSDIGVKLRPNPVPTCQKKSASRATIAIIASCLMIGVFSVGKRGFGICEVQTGDFLKDDRYHIS